jgi:hypothetical protein
MSAEKSTIPEQEYHQPYVFDERNEKDLSSIYRQIAVLPARDFDTEQKDVRLLELLEGALTKEQLMMPSEELIGDDNRLNLTFVTYIKHCAKDGNLDVAMEFCTFCDYFLLDYSKAFTKLHDKLKALVTRGYKHMIGVNEYKKLERRLNPNKPKTLMEIFGAKRQ